MNDKIVTKALDKIESAFPEVPQTAEELVARWASRDAQYAQSRIPMDAEQVEVIRMTRMQEAGQLPNYRERAKVYARAKSWVPPVHPDFGGMQDWLN